MCIAYRFSAEKSPIDWKAWKKIYFFLLVFAYMFPLFLLKLHNLGQGEACSCSHFMVEKWVLHYKNLTSLHWKQWKTLYSKGIILHIPKQVYPYLQRIRLTLFLELLAPQYSLPDTLLQDALTEQCQMRENLETNRNLVRRAGKPWTKRWFNSFCLHGACLLFSTKMCRHVETFVLTFVVLLYIFCFSCIYSF